MSSVKGKAGLPLPFITKHLIPCLLEDLSRAKLLRSMWRRYFKKYDPNKDVPISQISLRVNEACNLRCASCGQWGENGHLREKVKAGHKLDQLDFEVVKKLIADTKHDCPTYYIWGGEPTLWKPLVPLFQELGKNKLYGSIVSNAQALEPILEELIDTGALMILFLSLDGWDSASQNKMRAPAGGEGVGSDNFEKIMGVINKVDEIKKRKKLKYPMVVPITVVSNLNYEHLADIHRLVMDKTQLHPYYYGWYITEERAKEYETVYKKCFGEVPTAHRGYLKSCFNDVDAEITSKQIKEVMKISKGRESVPQILPDIYEKEDIERYYNDHTWTCGYDKCQSIYHVVEVSPDGRVTPCRDYQDYTVGNINEQPFYEIWNGEKYKEFRRQLAKGLMPVCSRCCGLQGF
ncbi:MAG: SPASM domain-containing protein [Chitinivibrionia bacterium]|nr:SPASM domain-containing protein [Chitinivibrionia bacterium]